MTSPAQSSDWLEQSASLAMSALLARLDMAHHARPFFWVDYRADPPLASHSYWDYCDIAGRFVDGLILARQMTGRQDGADEEATLRAFFFAQQDAGDGLFYNPEPDAEMSKYAPDMGTTVAARHVDMFCQRAPLLAMTTLLALGDESVLPRLQHMVRGLIDISERNGDEARFSTYRWARTLQPGWYEGANIPEHWQGYRYALLTGLPRYAQLAGDEQALAFAQRLARHYMRHGDVPPDGCFRGNTHSGGILPTTVGITRVGLLAADQEMVDWAHRVYAWVREQTPEFGFLSDGLGLEGFFAGTCETCGLADLQHLAMLFSESNVGDYWDDLERVARNQLVQNQYADASLLRQALPNITQSVLNMLHGGFECAAHPNHLLTWDGAEGCCIGGGLRALYHTWQSALLETPNEVRVNMGISRHSPGVRVTAHEPQAGRIDVSLSGGAPRRILVRLPGHAAMHEAQALIDAVPVNVTWHGRYAQFEAIRPGQVASLVYPLREDTRTYTIAGQPYTGHWRGHTMLEISPRGERYPIYASTGSLPG
jgi:hypothetical protein